MWTNPARAASPDIGVNVGLLVASATAPGTFASSLAARSAVDQGLVTALSTGLHYLLTLGRAGRAAGARRTGRRDGADSGRAAGPAADPDAGGRPRRRPARLRPGAGAADPAGRTGPARPAPADRLAVRGDRAGRRPAHRGPGRRGRRGCPARRGRADRRLPAGRAGRARARVPARAAPGPGARASRTSRSTRSGPRRRSRSLGLAGGTTGALVGAAYAEHELATWLGRRLAAVLPGGPLLWRLAGHARLPRRRWRSPPPRCGDGRCGGSRPAPRTSRRSSGPGRTCAGPAAR